MKFTRQQIIDFIVLSLRWYLAFYMFDYGIGKIFGNQFGKVDQKIIATPIKDVNTFYIAWYLFSLSRFFNIAVGCAQIFGALLIVFNRTAILGTLFLLPVLIQIFLIDASFTRQMFGYALTCRLAGMVTADFIILYHYRDKLKIAFSNLTDRIDTRIGFKWWIYLALPIIGFLMDFVLRILTWPLQLLLQHLRH